MILHFAVVLVFLAVSMAVVFLAVFLSRRLQPRHPGPVKNSSYECGEIPSGDARINFNPRFYTIALAFLIFDVEIALIYPVAVIFRDFVRSGNGLFALFEILLFAWILFIGLIYLWRNGYLNWADISQEDTDINSHAE